MIPDNHFTVPLVEEEEPSFPHSLITAHGPWPLYRHPADIEQRPVHFNSARSLSPPLLSTAARLLFFSRREVTPMGIPPNLPVDRAAAGDAIIPTQADVREVNAATHAALPYRAPPGWAHGLSGTDWYMEMRGVMDGLVRAPSARWDQDFARLFAFDPWDSPIIRGVAYNPGSMAGTWAGRMLVRRSWHTQPVRCRPELIDAISLPGSG